ncbi:MAG: ABC transporter ATP-binding protein [Verrucomicrobiota bacterium]
MACIHGGVLDDVGRPTVMETISAETLVKTFGKIVALDQVSLRIEAGELFFLLGPSGCGKTTLLRCIAGLETPESGVIRFGGRDITELAPHKRETALVFQSYALWPHLNVAQNIAFGLEERRVAKPEIKRRVEEALELVQLPGFGPRAIEQMSGGQQQRVALARAMVVKPKCLLLDEPLSNLDAQLRLEMRLEIRRLVKSNGLTAIYVTHDQEEALSMADRMAILSHGRIAQIGTPEEVYRTPHSAIVASFIGETNLIAATMLESSGQTVTVATAVGPLHGRLSDPGWRPPTGAAVQVSIRPEAWCLHGQAGDNVIDGTLAARSYLGQRIQYWIDTAAGRQQVVEINPHQLHPPGGQNVQLHVRPEDVLVLQENN